MLCAGWADHPDWLVTEIADDVGDSVTVADHGEHHTGQLVTTQAVTGLASFVPVARAFRVALAMFLDVGAISLGDLAQDGDGDDGYAVNIHMSPFSEEGTAPVERWQHRQAFRRAVHRLVTVPTRRWLRSPTATGAGVAFDSECAIASQHA